MRPTKIKQEKEKKTAVRTRQIEAVGNANQHNICVGPLGPLKNAVKNLFAQLVDFVQDEHVARRTRPAKLDSNPRQNK